MLLAVSAAAFVALFLGLGPQDARALLRDEEPGKQKKLSLVTEPATGGVDAPRPVAATMTNAVYRTVAPDISNISQDNFAYARQSVFDPTWASVRVYTPDGSGYHVVFLRKSGESWMPDRSVFSGPYTDPRNLEPLLRPVPGDLTNMLFSTPQFTDDGDAGEQAVAAIKEASGKEEWSVTSENSEGSRHVVQVAHEADEKDEKDLGTKVYLTGEDGTWTVNAIGQELTSTEAPGFPEKLVKHADADDPQPADHGSSKTVVTGVESEKVEDGLSAAKGAVEEYPGVAGFYVQDLEGGFSYGVRPDEEFFSASVIKVPIMVAVFRRIEQGKLSFDKTLTLTEEDMAPGSGGLAYESVGSEQRVEDLLWLMITQSDNVATNILVRAVGGEEYVNEVSRSLGATDTVMRQKVTVERAAVPALDNQTTPRDMAEILTKIYTGQAASEDHCREMVDLMHQNEQELWMENGIPSDVPVANKGGWLDSTFNDVGIVEYEDHPYVLSAFTKYGVNDIYLGEALLTEVSENVWEIESSGNFDEDKKDKDEKDEGAK